MTCFQKKDVASDVGSFRDTLVRFSVTEIIWCRTGNALLWWGHAKSLDWKWAMLCTLALSTVCSLYGSQEPLVFRVPRLRGCAVSGKNPVRLFHQTRWSFAVSAVLHIPRVVMGGFFTNIPVNLVFLHGLEVPCVKFGFQTPALSHSYPYDQQMELREYYFLEVKEIISPWFSWLELEWYIFPCVSFPFSY